MKTLKKFDLIFAVVLVGYLFFTFVPTGQGFMSFRHRHGLKKTQ